MTAFNKSGYGQLPFSTLMHAEDLLFPLVPSVGSGTSLDNIQSTGMLSAAAMAQKASAIRCNLRTLK